ncbi:MAG: lysine--tRNA ligase [Dehalococcoidia bacterium]|nr:lysine--tRNA ligase [Dehalococcoidia bacterium]
MPLPSDELVQARLEKLEGLRKKGVDPYPRNYERTHTAQEAIEHFESVAFSGEGESEIDHVSIGGRVTALRGMGRVTFCDILDGSGKIQAMFRSNTLGEEYQTLDYVDIGDWIGVSGSMIRTRTGEVTVQAGSFTILCKTLRPLPEKWHGLTDTEVRYRQRYLDLISNPDARKIAVMRSGMVRAIRRFMYRRGFIEVETPILVPVAAGGMAHPFETHHNALSRDLFLRIATELHLKRLIVGGLEKVYEIGRIFRNEGIDANHNPEFTTMESYEAFADYNDVMSLVEELVSTVAAEVTGSAVVEYGDNSIDFTPPWPRLSLVEQIGKFSGINILEHQEVESLKLEMEANGIDVSNQVSWAGLVDKLISTRVEPNLIAPCFLVDYPVQVSPLAKRAAYDDRLVERFEAFVSGMEIANAFTELNDPIDQRARFEAQEEFRSELPEEEWDRLDEDFLTAIEYGMPPTGGLGMGIDRLAMLLCGQRTIREVVLFPQMRT